MLSNQLTAELTTFCTGESSTPAALWARLMLPPRAAEPSTISSATAMTRMATRIPFFFRYSFTEAPLPVF